MNARILARLDDIQASYWFIPSLMAAGAILLAFGLTFLDGHLGGEWIKEVSWLYAFQPDGARSFLTTIAGSMIGVAGVTFSITIASVVYASGQYGPRLLSNFMSDQGNQITLGTFIATFLYCLLVLSTIRAEGGGSTGDDPAVDVFGSFVPHVAVLTGLGLALASIGVLIFFIHHVPESIHVANVISGIGRELRDKVDTLFPERLGLDKPGERARDADEIRTGIPERFYEDAEPIRADGNGYVQGLDGRALLGLATEHDLLMRVRHRPGDFVSEGDTLVLAWPPDSLSDEVRRRLRVAFAWGSQRSPMQDVRFLVDELVEIAARALSPGVNDPFTAISCMDWLAASLKVLATREFPGADRYDEHGALRIIAEPTSFEEFVGAVYGQLRPYVSADRNAALHALKTIAEVAGRVTEADHAAELRRQADAIHEGAMRSLALEADRASVADRHRAVVRLIAGRDGFQALSSQTDWIGGTA